MRSKVQSREVVDGRSLQQREQGANRSGERRRPILRVAVTALATGALAGVAGCSSGDGDGGPGCAVESAQASVDVDVDESADTVTVTMTSRAHQEVVEVELATDDGSQTDSATLTDLGDSHTSRAVDDGATVAVTATARFSKTRSPAECYQDGAVVYEDAVSV